MITYFCPSCGSFLPSNDMQDDFLVCMVCRRLTPAEKARSYSADTQSERYFADEAHARPKLAVNRVRGKNQRTVAERAARRANRL